MREDGPYVAVLEDYTPAESMADLYVVVEPVSPGSEAFCAELLNLIESHFGQPQYSVTGNLLQSLRAAQEHLRAWNKNSQGEQRVAAGATCLAVSGATAYLAQVGPAVAYFRHGGRLQRFEPLEPESQAALGTTIACTPSFSRFELSQGDTLLLTSSRFRTLVEDSTADAILALPPGEALPQVFRVSRLEAEFSALYLAVTGDPRREVADSWDSEVLDASDGNPALNRSDHAHVSGQLLRDGPTAHAVDDSRVQDMLSEPLEPAGSPALARSNMAQRRQLDRLTDHRSLMPPKPVLYALASVVALIFAGRAGLPHLSQAGRSDRFQRLVRDASSEEQSALNQADPGQKRAMLNKAQTDLDEAKLLRPQSPDVASLQSGTSKALTDLNAVRQLTSSTTLVDLATTPIPESSAVELAVSSELYLLDDSAGQVYAFSLQGQQGPTAPVFSAGKLIESVQTGRAQHIAVQPPANGTPGQLYILDSNRRLFSRDTSGTFRSVALVGTNQWKSATAMAVTGSELYILDSSGGRIWRYSASSDGFTQPPTAINLKSDLRDAVQIAVDGDIYVSTMSGHLASLSNGSEQQITVRGIDSPLLSPQVPFADPQTGMRYIADAGNQRIIAMDQNNVYRSQYIGAALHGLRSIAFDPNSGLIYALSGRTIVSAPIR